MWWTFKLLFRHQNIVTHTMLRKRRSKGLTSLLADEKEDFIINKVTHFSIFFVLSQTYFSWVALIPSLITKNGAIYLINFDTTHLMVVSVAERPHRFHSRTISLFFTSLFTNFISSLSLLFCSSFRLFTGAKSADLFTHFLIWWSDDPPSFVAHFVFIFVRRKKRETSSPLRKVKCEEEHGKECHE